MANLSSGSGGGSSSSDDDDDNRERRRQFIGGSRPDRSSSGRDRLDAPGGADTSAGDTKNRSDEAEKSAAGDDRLEAPGGADTSEDGNPQPSQGGKESTGQTSSDSGGDGLIDSVVDGVKSTVQEGRDLDQKARDHLHEARVKSRDTLFSVTGDARGTIEDRQQEGLNTTRETTSNAVDILVGNERVVGENVSGGPLPVFSAVGGRSAATKGVKGAKDFVNAARGAEAGTVRGAATGGSAGSGGAARAAARHGEFVVKGVDNVVDSVRAAGATAGAGALAAANSEIELPGDTPASEQSEVETPESPANVNERAEIDISGRESIHPSELGISGDFDQSEIDVNGPPGTTLTDDGEIQLPAQAAGVVVKGKLKEDEEEEDEEEGEEEEEEEEEVDEDVVVEVPPELIPDGEVIIGGETSSADHTTTQDVDETQGDEFNEPDDTEAEEVNEDILDEDFDKIQGDEFAEPDGTEVDEVDRDLEEDTDSVVDDLFANGPAFGMTDEETTTGLDDRGDMDFTGGMDDIDDDLDFDQGRPGEDTDIDDDLDAPPWSPPGQTTDTPDIAPDLTPPTTGNPNAPGNPNQSGNPFEPSGPRHSGTPTRIRLPSLPDIDVDAGETSRRRRGLFDREFEIDPATPEDIISGEALDLDDIDFEG